MNKLLSAFRRNIGLTFVLPAAIAYAIFTVIPLITTVSYSLFKWNGIDPVMKFVGLKNYIMLFQDPIFIESLYHNIIWIVLSITVPIVIGLLLATLLSLREVKLKGFFKTIYFMPMVLSLPIVGIIWNWMYSSQYGLISSIIKLFGYNVTIPWLGSESLVILALFIAGFWSGMGFNVVVFLAAFQGIDPVYYECAILEGANRFQMSVKITIPLIKNVVTMLIINSMIGAFNVFDIVYVMTKGGPYHSSEMIATYMYDQTFNQFKFGYGSAMATIMTIFVCVIAFVSLRLSNRGDN